MQSVLLIFPLHYTTPIIVKRILTHFYKHCRTILYALYFVFCIFVIVFFSKRQQRIYARFWKILIQKKNFKKEKNSWKYVLSGKIIFPNESIKQIFFLVLVNIKILFLENPNFFFFASFCHKT